MRGCVGAAGDGAEAADLRLYLLVIGIGWLGHHRKFNYIRQVDGGLLWLNLLYLLLALPRAVRDQPAQRAFRPDLVDRLCRRDGALMLLSAGLSAYGLRAPYLSAPDLRPGARQDMILSPFLTGALFLASAAMAFGERLSLAHWVLVLIVPVSVWFGSRARKIA